MRDTHTTETDNPTTISVDSLHTTETDEPTGAPIEPGDDVPTLEFGVNFLYVLEADEGVAIRIPSLVAVKDSTSEARPISVSIAVKNHPERMLLTVIAINEQPVVPPIDLIKRARVSDNMDGSTLFVFDIDPTAPLPIDIWVETKDGPIQFIGEHTTITAAQADELATLETEPVPAIPNPAAVFTPAVNVIDRGPPARPGALPILGGYTVHEPTVAIEPVPESEANEPAGLAPHPSEGEREIRLILVGAAKAALHKLIDGITEESAARNLSQIGKTALDLRKTLSRFGMHAFPEEEVMSNQERWVRRSVNGGSMNRETMGVAALKEMVSVFTTFTKPAELEKAIHSLSSMKRIEDPEGNLTAAIGQLEAKVITLTAAVTTAPGINVNAVADAAGVVMTGATANAWEGGSNFGLGGYSMGGYIDDSDDDDNDYDDEDDEDLVDGVVNGVLATIPVAYGG